jgi:SPP1 family predicted phage head-tail adaptor
MQAGKLRHRVILQQQATGRDSFGGEVVNWTPYATVWAAVEPLAGQERYDPVGAQLLADVSHRIRIRYREGLTHKMRVSWDGRLFDIQAVVNLETRDREIHLLCKEKPDG